ncbi:unnamed protein product [Ixodes pacificus]
MTCLSGYVLVHSFQHLSTAFLREVFFFYVLHCDLEYVRQYRSILSREDSFYFFHSSWTCLHLGSCMCSCWCLH